MPNNDLSAQLKEQGYEIIKRDVPIDGPLYDFEVISIGENQLVRDILGRFVLFRGKDHHLQVKLKNRQEKVIALTGHFDGSDDSFQFSKIEVEDKDFSQQLEINLPIDASIGQVYQMTYQIFSQGAEPLFEEVEFVVLEQSRQYLGQPLSQVEHHAYLLKFAQFTSEDCKKTQVYDRLNPNSLVNLPKDVKLVLAEENTNFSGQNKSETVLTSTYDVEDKPISLSRVGKEKRRLIAVFPDYSKLLIADIEVDIISQPSPVHYKGEDNLEKAILESIDRLKDQRIVYRRVVTSMKEALLYRQANVEIMLDNAQSLLLPVHIVK